MENNGIELVISILEDIRADLRTHYEADAKAWATVNRHEGVLKTVKWTLTTLAGLLGLSWLSKYF